MERGRFILQDSLGEQGIEGGGGRGRHHEHTREHDGAVLLPVCRGDAEGLQVAEHHGRQREDANGSIFQPHVELPQDASGAHGRHRDVDAAQDQGQSRADASRVGHVHQRRLDREEEARGKALDDLAHLQSLLDACPTVCEQCQATRSGNSTKVLHEAHGVRVDPRGSHCPLQDQVSRRIGEGVDHDEGIRGHQHLDGAPRLPP
mmetsp:Transcript_5927/g.15133  ORF Transcript_5927/g.15133 Transcript_5927/m.15133 type:complete len:204 (+) Transcript_5927:808-1419(+)